MKNFDELYLEWAGHEHTQDIERNIYDSAQMQDFAGYCTAELREDLAEKQAQIIQQLAEARAEVERLALEIENQQYTITCASEENQQLKESLAEARAEIERLKCCTNCGSRLWAATGNGDCKNCKDFSAWTSQSDAAKRQKGAGNEPKAQTAAGKYTADAA